MTHKAAFAQTIQMGIVAATIATGNMNTNVPTETIKIATAGEEGALITSLTAIPRETVTSTALYLFISKDGGATKHLLDSALMEAHTVDTTTAIVQTTFSNITKDMPVRLSLNDELYVGIGVSGNIAFTASSTDF